MKHSYMTAAQKLDLFHTAEHSPGFAWWHPNGLRLLEALKTLIRDVHAKYGYDEVKTPNLAGAALFEQSGHLAKFRKNMFVVTGDEGDRDYVVRPMSCPNHIDIFSVRRRSYAELPIKLLEFGEVVRNEPSGSLQALFRMRGFCQDDSHIFAMDDQVVKVVAEYIAMARELYTILGFSDVCYQISLRPTQRFGADSLWDKAEEMLRAACQKNGLTWAEEVGGGAFYGPKLEIHLKDTLGRSWQMGTIQLDYVLPHRFELEYITRDNQQATPVILHHAVLGSLERFIGVLLEQYGVNLPGILRPLQIALIGVSDTDETYLESVAYRLQAQNLRVKLFRGAVRLGDKVKAAQQEHPEYIVVAGRKETEAQMLTVRENNQQRCVPLESFIQEATQRCVQKLSPAST